MADSIVAAVLLDLALIVLAARGARAFARRIGQPAVVGEITAGVLLGPTLLGALPGDPSHRLFPLDARPYLALVGQLGLVLFMFQVGLDLNLRPLSRARAVVSVAAGSVILPFAVGALPLASLLWSHYSPAGVPRVPFALFIGVALSITAFPVLARILLERGAERTHLGTLTLAAAAVNDLAGWLILTVVLAMLGTGDSPGVGTALGGTVAFVLVVFGILRRQILWRVHRKFLTSRRLTDGTLAVTLAIVLIGAWVTGATGTHVIFGAFLLGMAWPRADHKRFAREVRRRINPITQLVLLPTFFVLPGFSVNLERLDLHDLGILTLVLVCAIGSKTAGAATGATTAGFAWRDSMAIGTLMNTRGLMELIVLNIGLSRGVLPPDLYTLLVVMAIVTTVMTMPVLRWMGPASGDLAARDDRPSPDSGAPDAQHVHPNTATQSGNSLLSS